MCRNNLRMIVIVVVCFSLVVISNSSVSAARWYEDYQTAEKALNQEDWTTAIDLLKKVIEKEPESGKRKRTYGTNSIEYYPYLKLGQAYFKMGDLENARRYCEQEKKKGVAPQKEVDECLKAAELASASISPAPSPQPPIQTPRPIPEDKIKVAVLDFESIQAPPDLGRGVAEILRTELIELGTYTMVERGKVEEILKEQAFQLTGAVDSKTAAKIGELVGAKFVITGSIVKMKATYTINARLINVETGIAKVGDNVQAQGEGEIPNKVHDLALKLTSRTVDAE
jgi:TolB-like protein